MTRCLREAFHVLAACLGHGWRTGRRQEYQLCRAGNIGADRCRRGKSPIRLDAAAGLQGNKVPARLRDEQFG